MRAVSADGGRIRGGSITSLDRVARFLDEKVLRLGPVPEGADFNSLEAQERRFAQMTCVLDLRTPFSLLDFGCGYGALGPILLERGPPLTAYTGDDVASAMIEHTRSFLPERLEAQLTTRLEEAEPADFVVASGIFNIKFDVPVGEWKAHVIETPSASRHSRRGFPLAC
jgi:SAM-dependent methyltransferase